MDAIFWLKLVVTMVVVILLALIAERGSPRLSGLLAGFPHGIAILLAFMALEQGEAFAAMAARHAVSGLAANAALGWAWGALLQAMDRPSSGRGHAATGRAGRMRQPGGKEGDCRSAGRNGPAVTGRATILLLAATSGLVAFLAVAWLFLRLSLPLPVAALAALAVMAVAAWWMRRAEDVIISRPVPLTLPLLLARALAAAAIVVLITGAARYLGPAWAGLLAGFPVVTFPFLLIVQATYGPAPVRAVLRAYPQGLPALLAFALVFALALPRTGLLMALLAGFAAAILYSAARMWVTSALAGSTAGRS
jgi:hypothetical protein